MGSETDTADASPRIQFSAGIMAYNEAANIASAIASITGQRSTLTDLREVIVVASGCTDDTVPIVNGIARQDTRVRVVVQERREGKASAINLFLREATAPVLLMASADVILKEGALDLLIGAFRDEKVGMVGAHPVPVNDDGDLLGYTVRLLWKLHDQIAREEPKLGEVVAFRNVVPSIPADTPVDEISIQALITQLNYQLRYASDAIIYNRGPTTLSDFIRQRRRIYSGHLMIQRQQGYSASTMSVGRVFRALLATHPFSTPRDAAYTTAAIALEGWSRTLGAFDFVQRRPHHLWQISTTTKNHIADVAHAPTRQSVLVFHVVDYHEHEIELGARGCQSLITQAVLRMRRRIGVNGSIAPERNGAIIAMLPCDRDEAERIAGELISDLISTPVRIHGRSDGVNIKLACGIIEFQQEGRAIVSAMPAPA